MATASTSKKIQRVQRSGVTRRVGQRRPMGFPAAVAAIIIIGLVLVWFARDSRINVNGDQPRANRDGWYEAFGILKCDTYEPALPAASQDADITTPGFGIINVFPTTDETAGDNAVLGKFFETAGMKVTDTSVTTEDGLELKAGQECGAGDKKTNDTVIKLFIWPPQASDKTEPEVVTEDFGDVRFTEDRGIYALALVPESTEKIDLPASADALPNAESLTPQTTVAPTGDTTTVPGDTTTVPGDTTTVAPSTTVAPTTTGN